MTARPQPPGRLLAIADYVALSDDDRNRRELQGGNPDATSIARRDEGVR
jgi:hypothetical protein